MIRKKKIKNGPEPPKLVRQILLKQVQLKSSILFGFSMKS